VPIAIAIILSSAVYSFNILDRFALKDESEDVGSLAFRINAAEKSIELFKSSPLFGVGLGNFGNYSEGRIAFEIHLLNEQNRITYQELGAYSPHNVIFSILAEAGAFGITTFLALLAYFFYRDISYISKKKEMSFPMVYIVSFWTMFVFMLFNPSHSIFVVGWFWLLRGAIEASYVSV
jgi:O-antigen ligase